MSKRKAATKRPLSNHKPASMPKRAQRPKVATQAQHKKQAVIRSPKDRTSRPAHAGSPDAPTKVHHEPKAQAPIIDNRARAAALETVLQASLQNASGPKMNDNIPGRGFDLFLPFANMQAYQAKLLEVTQANAQFAFEFSLRIARIRSPLEFWAVIAEFTGRRFLTIMNDSKELAAFWRTDAIQDVTALPRR
jgi:hypothetical protein